VALVIIEKNEIRVALLNYHREIIDILEKYNYKIHEFDGELDYVANNIKQDMRNYPHKDAIRKALKGARRKIFEAAKKSRTANKINKDAFFQNYFGGIPLDSKSLSEAPYDMVIEIEPHNTVAWVFSPNEHENLNNNEIMNQVQCDFNKQCSQVLTKYPVDIKDTQMIEFAYEEPKKSSKLFESKPEEEPETQCEESELENPDYIGRVEFGNKSKMLLNEKKIYDKIEGLIKEEEASSVTPNDILVLESRKRDGIILATVVKMEINQKNTATNFESYSYLGVKIIMRPLLQKYEGYEGKIVPTSLLGYQIRKPTTEEAALVTNAPKTGLPLGHLDFGNHKTVCYYPFDPNSKTLDSTIYQSVFIAGVQGSGKTTGLKFLCQALTANKKIDYEKRPAIIIIDGENSFTEFTPNEKMHPEVQEFLSQHEIGNVDSQVLTLSDNEERSDSTLSLRKVTYKDMMYLIPELESKTENIMLQALRMAFHIIKISPELDFTIENLRNVAIAQARNSGLIHPSQIPALSRALHCDELDMFNQPNKTEISPELLLQPGKITVLNVHNLDKNRRRVVALYVQQILNQFKMETLNKYPGAILVVDEAELLFPNKPSKREKDYVDRIAERMEDVTNRGRKRFYGLFIVSHLPSEVSPKVVALANTKMVFRTSGANSWVSSAIGKEYVDEINDLPIGTCRIKVNISTVDQKPVNAKLYMPNVEEVSK